MKRDQNSDAWFTTMVDLYRLPQDFPGYTDCAREASPIRRVECLERHLEIDNQHPRFIPYIQLHEFEALLFSDPHKFEVAFPDRPEVAQLRAIRDQFETPEHINDRPDLAPSQRILELLPAYCKA